MTVGERAGTVGGMTTGRWISRVAAVSVLLVACRAGDKKPAREEASSPTTAPLPPPEPKPTFTATSLRCFLAANAKHFDEDTQGLPRDSSGPGECARVLTLFLREHPQAHIMSVIPIEYPNPAARSDLGFNDEGTQELLVLHADRGPWPVAGSLRVESIILCSEKGRHGPAYCRAALEESLKFLQGVEFWVPLTAHVKDAISSPGTQVILTLRPPPPGLQ